MEQIKADEGMSDVDDFDFICHIAFDQKPLTRRDRAENVKKRNVFAKYGAEARAVLEALLEKYADSGIYEIEDMDILKLDPFVKFGKPEARKNRFIIRWQRGLYPSDKRTGTRNL